MVCHRMPSTAIANAEIPGARYIQEPPEGHLRSGCTGCRSRAIEQIFLHIRPIHRSVRCEWNRIIVAVQYVSGSLPGTDRSEQRHFTGAEELAEIRAHRSGNVFGWLCNQRSVCEMAKGSSVTAASATFGQKSSETTPRPVRRMLWWQSTIIEKSTNLKSWDYCHCCNIFLLKIDNFVQ